MKLYSEHNEESPQPETEKGLKTVVIYKMHKNYPKISELLVIGEEIEELNSIIL